MRYVLGFLIAGSLALSSLAVPPNDDFANRTLLSGTDISFSGTLLNSSWETESNEIKPDFLALANESVWWEWTAPMSAVVVIEITNPSRESIRQDALSVYELTNISTGTLVAADFIDTRFPHMFFSFRAEAGTNYQIQLAGKDNAGFSFRLVATNAPYIIEQPKSQTVTADDSTMLGVVSTGLIPFTFQWNHNGTNLPGETRPILILNQVTAGQAGTYSVDVFDPLSTVTSSDTVTVTVTPADTTSALAALPKSGSNVFSFTLLGEVGRRYRIQSSTNLINWTNDFFFPSLFFDLNTSTHPFCSVVFDATGTDPYGPTLNAPQRFYRAAPFHAVNEVCNNYLKMFRYAQLLWAYDQDQFADYPVSFGDLFPYVPLINGNFPFCPNGGTYSLTLPIANPQCSLHPFEEP